MRELLASAALSIALLLSLDAYASQPGRMKVSIHYLFAQPNASAAATAVAATGGDLVEEYDSFAVASMPKPAIDALTANLSGHRMQVVPHDEYDTVQLPGGVLDTRTGAAGSFPGRPLGAAYKPNEAGMYVIQFYGPIRAEWINELTNDGLTFVQYVPFNAYLIAATPRQVARTMPLKYVQFVDQFHSFLKAQGVSGKAGERFDYIVQLADTPGVNAAIDEIAAWSSEPLVKRYLPEHEIQVRGRFLYDSVAILAGIPLVFGVADVPRIALSDERVALSVSSSNVDATSRAPIHARHYLDWLAEVCPFCGSLKADGFWVGLADTGLDGGASQSPSQRRVELASPNASTDRVKFGVNVCDSSDTTLADPWAHGTMNAAIAAGMPATTSGSDPNGFYYGAGIAPSAGIFITKIRCDSTQLDVTDIFGTAADVRAANPTVCIQNHSYNQYTSGNGGYSAVTGQWTCTDNQGHTLVYYDGYYDLESRAFDQAVKNGSSNGGGTLVTATPLTFTVSSGNKFSQGYAIYQSAMEGCDAQWRQTLPPGTAKNVISVGGAESVRPVTEQWGCMEGTQATSFNNIMSGSKRGTRIVGWYKPDLFAPSTLVTSVRTTTPDASIMPIDYAFCYRRPNFPVPPAINVFAPYFGGSGTSFAAPVAAGAAVLASRVYAEAKNHDCHATSTCDASAASPALIKAMLVGSARSMMGGIDRADTLTNSTPGTTIIGALPNDQQGFGRIHLDDMLSEYPARAYVNEDTSLTAGQNKTYTFTVHDQTLPVKVVLAWTDMWGLNGAPSGSLSPSASFPIPLVNDLNLAVEFGGACPSRYLGNRTAVRAGQSDRGEQSTIYTCTSGTSDSLNNVELVRFYPSVDGVSTFTVRVTAATAGSAQNYALFVWNAYDASSGSVSPPSQPSNFHTAMQVVGVAPRVVLTWSSSAGASSYEIQRKEIAGSEGWFHAIASSVGTSYTDPAVISGNSYVYRVRARNTAGVSPYSALQSATLVTFSDDPLTVQTTVVQASHVLELRNAINLFRQAVGLGNFTWSETITDATTPIKVSHINELRSALNAARNAAGIPTITFTDDTLTQQQSVVKGVHIRELRSALQ